MTSLVGYIFAAGLSLWFWIWPVESVATAMQIGSWRDMPPIQYQGIATATVSYMNLDVAQDWCGRDYIACYVPSLNMVVLNVECSPSRRPMVQRETVDVAALVRKFGHVNGWPGTHPR
jgi:hypothetical protein